MRNCLRCGFEMVENLEMLTTNGQYFELRKKGLFKWNVGKITCASCPGCGYIEMFVEDTKKVKKMSDKQRNKNKNKEEDEKLESLENEIDNL